MLALLPLCLLCPPLQAQTIPTEAHPEALAPLKVVIDPTPYGYQDDKGVTRGTTPEFFVAIANLMGMCHSLKVLGTHPLSSTVIYLIRSVVHFS